ncbi:alpha/beta fold hydrolase [Ochrobactrum quorumnocens]|uniref:Alpha/beta hydrolase n=1 Tax=Ochrobactrum quorumnocens TaxID=271865 RepID=A0A5N1JSE6_9HYPH|nr:alpha/beta hydrolase [[Ochrobactrum] quorumnocens]KAA9367117.1 alpha/beta hydrolase [[Ochrobactrum] quorumnocens]
MRSRARAGTEQALEAATQAGKQAGMQRREQLSDVGGFRLRSVVIAGKDPKVTVVFLHGASCSLLDPLFTFAALCPPDMQMVFVDRPGHGQSEFGPASMLRPDAQADALALLLQQRGIEQAIIVGHSYGGAVAAAFAVRHRHRICGLLLLSPAAYPWVGGISWFNSVARLPVVGALFSFFIAPPFGALLLRQAIRSVFAPNALPEAYLQKSKAWQALRPRHFRHNARELGALSAWAAGASRHYCEIKAPTIIVSGDADEIVSIDVHAIPLARTIDGAALHVIAGMGHKSDHVARHLVMAAIGKLCGKPVDLTALARKIEAEIARDTAD